MSDMARYASGMTLAASSLAAVESPRLIPHAGDGERHILSLPDTKCAPTPSAGFNPAVAPCSRLRARREAVWRENGTC